MHELPTTFTLKRQYEIGDTVYTTIPEAGNPLEDVRVSCIVRYKFKPSHHSFESYVLEVGDKAHHEMVVRDALRMTPVPDEPMNYFREGTFSNA